MRPSRFVTALSLAVITMSVSACQLSPLGDPVDTRDIVIGADLELSGAAELVGTAYRRALELKAAQINTTGVLGSRKLRLEIKDNKSDASLSQANVADLVSQSDVAAVIMGVCSECAIASAPVLNEKRVPTVVLAPAHEVANPVTERRYVFKLGPNPSDGAAALAGELAREKIRKPALIVADDRYGEYGRSALTSELKKANIGIVATSRIKLTDTDVTRSVERLLADEPDALILWSFPAQAAAAAVAARTAGFKGRLFFDIAAAGELFLTEPTATATNNAIMISTQTMAIDDVVATTPAKAARKQWFRDYTSRYGGYNGYASFAADAAQLIVNAIRKVGGTNREQVRDVIESTQIDGISGPIRLTPDNHSGLMPQALVALVGRNGRWRLAST